MRFLAWVGDRLLGPRCPFCIHRGRGTRSLDRHLARVHHIPAPDGCHPVFHDLGVHAPTTTGGTR